MNLPVLKDITGIVSDSRVSLELLGISFGSLIRSFWAWHTTPVLPSLFLLLAADVLLFALDLEGFRLGLQGCGCQFPTYLWASEDLSPSLLLRIILATLTS